MTYPIMIAPSLLAADFTRLGEEVSAVEEGGADMLHLDIMDGHFVPNISFGPAVVAALRPITSLFFDVHLMLSRPEDYIDAFVAAGANRLIIHCETEKALEVLDQIHSHKIEAGISIKPDTPAEAISDNMLEHVDNILVMTVEPGFGGQDYKAQDKKIKTLLERAKGKASISVDGGINAQTIASAAAAGATTLIAGSAVFQSGRPYGAIMTELRRLAEGGLYDR